MSCYTCEINVQSPLIRGGEKGNTDSAQISQLVQHHISFKKQNKAKQKLLLRKSKTKGIKLQIYGILPFMNLGLFKKYFYQHFFLNLFYVFIYGCVGSSFLCEGFL